MLAIPGLLVDPHQDVHNRIFSHKVRHVGNSRF